MDRNSSLFPLLGAWIVGFSHARHNKHFSRLDGRCAWLNCARSVWRSAVGVLSIDDAHNWSSIYGLDF